MKNAQWPFKMAGKCFAILLSIFLFSQSGKGQENVLISETEQKAIFKKAIRLMYDNYIFSDRVKKIETEINKKFLNKGYKEKTRIFDFLEDLNNDFEHYGNDHHLNIFYGPEYVNKIKAAEKNISQSEPVAPAEFVNMVKYENFFLKKIERLDGNIGYFKFNKFEELQYAKLAIVSAMNFIGNSSAIVLDLTQNGGGSAETVHFIMNYFIPDSTYLGKFKRRINNEEIDLWTIKDPAIQKIPDNIPLYILVSKNTSSAAEALAYGLQQFGRATIIGEQTKGEGNPGKRFIINDILYIMIPTATNINSKTGTSWEGIGVSPDIKIAGNLALSKALIESCTILENKTDDKYLKQLYQWMRSMYQSQLNPQTPTTEFISTIIGNYGDGKSIASENGILYFINKKVKSKMTYMSDNTFFVEGKDYRLKFSDTSATEKYYLAFWMDGGSEKAIRISN